MEWILFLIIQCFYISKIWMQDFDLHSSICALVCLYFYLKQKIRVVFHFYFFFYWLNLILADVAKPLLQDQSLSPRWQEWIMLSSFTRVGDGEESHACPVFHEGKTIIMCAWVEVTDK